MYQHKVQYYETDRMGITHHSNYIRFMEEARSAFMEDNGISYAEMEAIGLSSPTLSVTCDYKKTTTYSDVIDIEISVLDCERVRVKLGYQMKKDGQVVCTGTTTHCFLNEKGRPISLKKEYPTLYDGFARHQVEKKFGA